MATGMHPEGVKKCGRKEARKGGRHVVRGEKTYKGKKVTGKIIRKTRVIGKSHAS